MKTLVCASLLLPFFEFAPPALAGGGENGALRTNCADALVMWNDVIAEFSAGATPVLPPHGEARAYAMTYLAMERAILAVREGAQPIGGDESKEQTAASAAAHDVLVRVYPAATARIDALAAAHLGAIAGQIDQKRALSAGQAAAVHVLSKRERDGWSNGDSGSLAEMRITALPTESTGVASAGSKSPWLEVVPFVLKNAAQFEIRLPYWRDFGGELHPDTLITGTRIFEKVERAVPPTVLTQFWSGSPVTAWNRVAHALSERAGLGIADRVRVLAVVNLAMADATLAALHGQATLGQWQEWWGERWSQTDDAAMPGDLLVDVSGGGFPTVIRQDFRPRLSAPLRRYPSVAATVASAAGAALGMIPNGKAMAFEFAPSGGYAVDRGRPRRFSSVGDAARECAFAASLDGHTSREACVAGYHLGEAIGTYVLKRMRAQHW